VKVLVTGGGGFIGGAIARALQARGDQVRSFSRGDYPELRELGIETVRGDLGDLDAVSAAVEGVDAVLHVAARFDLWGKYEDFHRVNTLGTQNVIAACRTHGVRVLVFTSTPSVVHGGGHVTGADESEPYPDHFEAHYPATKALAEQAVLAANDEALSTVALRPHLVWGPGDNSALPRLIARANVGRVKQVGPPRKIDTCYIDNCVEVHLAALDRLFAEGPSAACAGKPYFVTQDEPVTGPHHMNSLLKAAGLPPVEARISAGVARVAARAVEGVWKLLGRQTEPPVTRYMVSQLSTDHYYDLTAVKRDLDYAPSVSYDEGMRRLAVWIERERPYDALGSD
jgi:nucleoside-diphosphate-sugar epimerase